MLTQKISYKYFFTKDFNTPVSIGFEIKTLQPVAKVFFDRIYSISNLLFLELNKFSGQIIK